LYDAVRTLIDHIEIQRMDLYDAHKRWDSPRREYEDDYP